MSHDPAEYQLASEPAVAPENGQPGSLRSGDLFGVWWHNLGSGMAPLATEDQETHARRVCAEAWSAATAKNAGRIEQLRGLLSVAKCPNCDGSGAYTVETGGCDMDGENDTRECHQEQCQWCDERDALLANVEGQTRSATAPKPNSP